MKLKFPILVLTVLLLVLSACKDQLNINGKAEESAVVYALLDPSETTHFIKVNRAFVTSNNNLETANIPDSNYFSKVEGKVQEFYNGTLIREFPLTDTLIENKESGAFYYPKQKVYMFKTTESAPLKDNPGYVYKLDLNINNGEFHVNGETELVRDVKITSLTNSYSKFAFANPITNPSRYTGQNINGDYGTGFTYDLRLKIYFNEYTSATDFTEKSFVWPLKASDFSSDPNKKFNTQAGGEAFYKLIAQNVTSNSNIIKRNLTKIDIVLTSGSEVLYNYISVNKPSSSIAQNKITYTNLTATNNRKAYGIFSARTTTTLTKEENKIVNGAQLSAINENSMRELCKGGITGTLFFCSPDIQYQSKDFYCN